MKFGLQSPKGDQARWKSVSIPPMAIPKTMIITPAIRRTYVRGSTPSPAGKSQPSGSPQQAANKRLMKSHVKADHRQDIDNNHVARHQSSFECPPTPMMLAQARSLSASSGTTIWPLRR